MTFATDPVTKSTRGCVQFLLADEAEALKLRIQLGTQLEPNLPREFEKDDTSCLHVILPIYQHPRSGYIPQNFRRVVTLGRWLGF